MDRRRYEALRRINHDIQRERDLLREQRDIARDSGTKLVDQIRRLEVLERMFRHMGFAEVVEFTHEGRVDYIATSDDDEKAFICRYNAYPKQTGLWVSYSEGARQEVPQHQAATRL